MSQRKTTTDQQSLKVAKGASWASVAFYLLVAFEFFYMVSPFAAYLYAGYGPGLDWLAGSRSLSWLISFFLPHIVEQTRSPLVNSSEIVGGVLFVSGVLGFAIGAVQIYASKLRRRGSVQGGIYKWIRHPQYLALLTASLGMVLIWPRFLVLLGFVTVSFVYVALARIEERLCVQQFADYATYKRQTGMFLPRRLETTLGAPFRLLPRPQGRMSRAVVWVLVYVAALGVATVVGTAVKSHAVGNLYAHYTDEAAHISVGVLSPTTIAEVAQIAEGDDQVAAVLEDSRAADEDARFLNYVLPTEMFVSEIPMHLPEGAAFGHRLPEVHDPAHYKIVFTKARFRPGHAPTNAAIVKDAFNKSPIVEAWIDRGLGRVIRVIAPPDDAVYDDMPVPVF